MRFSPAYYQAKQIQDVLFMTICDKKTPVRDIARCATVFIELERFKREMRGIPKLAPTKPSELPLKHAKFIAPPAEPIEAEPKESL